MKHTAWLEITQTQAVNKMEKSQHFLSSHTEMQPSLGTITLFIPYVSYCLTEELLNQPALHTFNYQFRGELGQREVISRL